MRREAYYRNTDENKLYFDGSSDGMLKSGNILTIESEGYETLYLRVIKATADTFTVKRQIQMQRLLQDLLMELIRFM